MVASEIVYMLQLEVIVSHDGDGPSQLLINMVDQLQRKLTRKAAQEFLKKLVKDRWLVEVSAGASCCDHVSHVVSASKRSLWSRTTECSRTDAIHV